MHGTLRRILGATALVAAAAASFAGGPNYTYDYQNRIPYVWKLETWGGAVPVYTDLGNLKNASPLITNQKADDTVAAAWDQWNNVPSSTFRAHVVGDFSLLGLPDINRTNYLQVLGAWNGGGIDVIYDHDGGITGNSLGLFGVLGVTGIDWVDAHSNEILEAWVILNGSTVRTTDPNLVGFSGVLTHEFGHALNLAHSQANGAVIRHADPPQPRGCSAPWTGAVTASQLETMYPFLDPVPNGTGQFQFSVDRIDDIAAISNLYPAAGWPESKGTIKGRILLPDGETEIGSVNVIARNVADPFNDFTSYISGQVSKSQAGPDGSFELDGLTPGASYVVYVDNLMSGAYQVPRLLALPGPEEYYNAAESGDGETDDRCAFTTIPAVAGVPATIEIDFNKVKGAPVFKPLEVNATPNDMTADGSIIVGTLGNGHVFRYTAATGLQDIGGDIAVGGNPAISDDGTRIAATARATPTSVGQWALYENGAWTLLPPRPEAVSPCSNSWGTVWDISGDGQTVIGGTYGNGCANSGFRATKWTAAGGSQALQKSSDSPTRANRANAISYDGRVIAGWDDHSTGYRRGAYWVDGVEHVLPLFTLWGTGEGLDVTSDGSWITGLTSGPTFGGWRLSTADDNLEVLSNNAGPNDRNGSAYRVNGDGNIILGWNQLVSGRVPTIWTPQLGWSNFNTFLESQGTYAEGGLIGNGTAISSDGRIMAGFAASVFGNFGWILESPKSVVCHRPPGQKGKATHTIDVSFPEGLNDHMAHGDTIGMCQHGGI